MDMTSGLGRSGQAPPARPADDHDTRIAELERALDRAEQAAAALEQRHARLEAELTAALAMLDALIAELAATGGGDADG